MASNITRINLLIISICDKTDLDKLYWTAKSLHLSKKSSQAYNLPTHRQIVCLENALLRSNLRHRQLSTFCRFSGFSFPDAG